MVSIPRSGFCFVELEETNMNIRDKKVSIPRSGFCFVELAFSMRLIASASSFQSLGRDSVLSNQAALIYAPSERLVSIPRSGFCFVERKKARAMRDTLIVSIPRSGFCFVELTYTHQRDDDAASFNPSVGILFCRTNMTLASCRKLWRFQSLGRDSVLSNKEAG